jgi:GTPase
MQFRLTEGDGECVYLCGIDDNGYFYGLNQTELEETMKTLNEMAAELNAELNVIRKREKIENSETKTALEILVRQIPPDRECIEQSVAVLGNAEAGKSTLVGVLTQGELDNGKGKSRLQMFRHPHEISSGRTSSISHDILGFNAAGPIRMGGNWGNRFSSRQQIFNQATKIVEFLDLAGDIRYMKTTVYGLTSSSPDAVMVVISANKGIVGTAIEHLQIAKALKLPIFIVITKVDLCPESVIKNQMEKVRAVLSEIPFSYLSIKINSNDDVSNIAKQFQSSPCSVVPIFSTSSVSGAGLDLLTQFLNLLPPRVTKHDQELGKDGAVEFQIDQIWDRTTEFQKNVLGSHMAQINNEIGGNSPASSAGGSSYPDNFPPNMIGGNSREVTCSGRLVQGILKRGEKVYAGPGENGDFIVAHVDSIKRNDLTKRSIECGQVATIKFSFFGHFEMRKGLVLLSQPNYKNCSLTFIAHNCRLILANHSAPNESPKRNCLRVGQQATAHIGNIRQTVVINKIFVQNKTENKLSINDEIGRIQFSFLRHPEYLHVGRLVKWKIPGVILASHWSRASLKIFLSTRTQMFLFRGWLQNVPRSFSSKNWVR